MFSTMIKKIKWIIPNTSKKGLVLLCASLALWSNLAEAQTEMNFTQSEALKAKVKKLADATQTISSDFTQFKHIDFLSNDIESSGVLKFKAPDMVKWQYTKPLNYSIVFKDRTIFINDDGNKSNLDVGGSKLCERLNRLIASSIRGDMFDEEEFSMKFFTDTESDLVHFLPKDPQFSEFINAFHIRFDKKGEVVQVKMIEPSGDFTRIEFHNRKTNEALSNADFSQ